MLHCCCPAVLKRGCPADCATNQTQHEASKERIIALIDADQSMLATFEDDVRLQHSLITCCTVDLKQNLHHLQQQCLLLAACWLFCARVGLSVLSARQI
jgi:hypothetical protein